MSTPSVNSQRSVRVGRGVVCGTPTAANVSDRRRIAVCHLRCRPLLWLPCRVRQAAEMEYATGVRRAALALGCTGHQVAMPALEVFAQDALISPVLASDEEGVVQADPNPSRDSTQKLRAQWESGCLGRAAERRARASAWDPSIPRKTATRRAVGMCCRDFGRTVTADLPCQPLKAALTFRPG